MSADNSLEFKQTMDPRSVDVNQGNDKLGSLLWYGDGQVTLILRPHQTFVSIPLNALTKEANQLDERISFTYLQQSTRELLSQAGVQIDPGTSDGEIIDDIRTLTNIPLNVPFDEEPIEESISPFNRFRDALIDTILEAGGEIHEPASKILNIIEGLRSVLLTRTSL